MLSRSIQAALLLGASCGVSATTQFPRASSGDGYISVPVGSVTRQNKQPHKLARRRGKGFETSLINEDSFYAAEGKLHRSEEA